MESVSMFPTQGTEYLITIVFLVLFCFFWKFLTGGDAQVAEKSDEREERLGDEKVLPMGRKTKTVHDRSRQAKTN